MGLDAFPFVWVAVSFVTAYKVVEPDHLLSQNYLNHAHNDLLEIFAEYGAFGLVLLAAALIMYVVAATRLWSQRAVLSRPQSAVDRKSVVWGKSVAGRVDSGGRRIIKKKK